MEMWRSLKNRVGKIAEQPINSQLHHIWLVEWNGSIQVKWGGPQNGEGGESREELMSTEANDVLTIFWQLNRA